MRGRERERERKEREGGRETGGGGMGGGGVGGEGGPFPLCPVNGLAHDSYGSLLIALVVDYHLKWQIKKNYLSILFDG